MTCHPFLFAMFAGTALASGTSISSTRLAERIASHDAPLIVDVRTAEEFAAGHVPGALNIPHDELVHRWSALGARRDEEIVLYCKAGKREALASVTLENLGFSNTRLLEGGFDAWEAAHETKVIEHPRR